MSRLPIPFSNSTQWNNKLTFIENAWGKKYTSTLSVKHQKNTFQLRFYHSQGPIKPSLHGEVDDITTHKLSLGGAVCGNSVITWWKDFCINLHTDPWQLVWTLLQKERNLHWAFNAKSNLSLLTMFITSAGTGHHYSQTQLWKHKVPDYQ